MIQPFDFHEPTSMTEALALAQAPGARLFAGGCELVLAMRRGAVRYQNLVSIMKLPGLDTFTAHPKIGVEVGAQVRINRLASHIWVGKRWAALHEAIEQLHPPHILNMGTLIGNVCAAVNYYDLPTALFAHRAELRITDGTATRIVPIEAFYGADRQTAVQPGEMVASMFLPPPGPDAGSAFKKIYKARRREGDLHKINAAAYIALDPARERILDATLALGCIGAHPIRIPAAEAALVGQLADEAVFDAAAAQAMAAVAPMTDAPWVEEIRSEWIRILARDVLQQAASRARSRHDPAEDAHLAY
ncbi:FAD binding domain-containing protein [Gemmobacter fulvus]